MLEEKEEEEWETEEEDDVVVAMDETMHCVLGREWEVLPFGTLGKQVSLAVSSVGQLEQDL